MAQTLLIAIEYSSISASLITVAVMNNLKIGYCCLEIEGDRPTLKPPLYQEYKSKLQEL
jgi:hypothetical protein